MPNKMCEGEVDELRVWDVERTEAEIAEWNSVKLSGSEPNLIAYWSFDDATDECVTPIIHPVFVRARGNLKV